jgi:two-component system CheB/CheR fusion protein
LPKCILILLSETPVNGKINAKELEYSEKKTHSQRIRDLESELRETKERLQSAVEELETSNEELQSANEELQSTNEELQSLNEELHAVNSEHQLNIKELIELNDDLNNYFRASEIGKVFLDINLNIRKYTPSVTKQINLIESDIGRPISHISNNPGFLY